MAEAPQWIDGGSTTTWLERLQEQGPPEGTFSLRFDEAGTYDYVCNLHPNMTGTIEVTR